MSLVLNMTFSKHHHCNAVWPTRPHPAGTVRPAAPAPGAVRPAARAPVPEVDDRAGHVLGGRAAGPSRDLPNAGVRARGNARELRQISEIQLQHGNQFWAAAQVDAAHSEVGSDISVDADRTDQPSETSFDPEASFDPDAPDNGCYPELLQQLFDIQTALRGLSIAGGIAGAGIQSNYGCLETQLQDMHVTQRVVELEVAGSDSELLSKDQLPTQSVNRGSCSQV